MVTLPWTLQTGQQTEYSFMHKEKPVICIVGPTGAGKTAISLAIAKLHPCAVINMDSRQLYADFPIITAQPSFAEQSVCPHLLYGFLPTQAKISAGEYARLAHKHMAELQEKKQLPVFVGGTGLYCKAVFEGLAEIPPVPEEISLYLQKRCAEEGANALYAELLNIDKDYASKIHPNDKQRITRALEVWESTGKTFSWWHKEGPVQSKHTPFQIGIGLSLSELEPLLVKRIDIMLSLGAVEEAKKAFENCKDANAPGWTGIGCRELLAHITGSISLDECRELWVKNTRAYAKRQWTWFRGRQGITWFAPSDIDGVTRHLQNNFPF